MKELTLIMCVFLLCSCNKTLKKDGGLKIEVEFVEKSLPQTEKDHIFNIIKNRAIGLSNYTPQIQLIENRISIELPLENDISLYKNMLLRKGKFEINKVHLLPEIYENLKEINNKCQAYDVSKDDSIKLFSVFHLNLNKKNEPLNEPILGFSAIKDTMAISKLFLKSRDLGLIPSNLSFRWNLLESYDQVALYVVDSNPIISNVMLKPIEDIKKPSINLKNEYANDWLEFTKQNIGKHIAMSIDHKVFSYPRINDAIKSGFVYKYLGVSISDKVWLFVAPLIKEELLNTKLKIKKIEYVAPYVDRKDNRVSISSEKIKEIFNSKVYLILSNGESNNSYHKHLHMFNENGVDFFPIYTSQEDANKTEMIFPKAIPFDGILLALTVKDSMVYKINYGLDSEVDILGKTIKRILSSEIEKYKIENKDILKGIKF